MSQTIRIAAAQTETRTIPFRVGGPREALVQVRANLDALVALAHRAADDGCHIVAFPEDCVGTLEWEAGHWQEVHDLLIPAGEMMRDRLGEVARERALALVYCSDLVRHDGAGSGASLPVYNTRSEEHTSELQSRRNLVCRLLLEKKNIVLQIIIS